MKLSNESDVEFNLRAYDHLAHKNGVPPMNLIEATSARGSSKRN